MWMKVQVLAFPPSLILFNFPSSYVPFIPSWFPTSSHLCLLHRPCWFPSLDSMTVLIINKWPILLTHFKWIKQEKSSAQRRTWCLKICKSEVQIEQILLVRKHVFQHYSFFYIISDNKSVTMLTVYLSTIILM